MQAIAAIGHSEANERTRQQERISSAAREFEAQMMKELLLPMTASTVPGAEGDADSSGSGGLLGEFSAEALGRALSERGGFGIAARIVRELTPAEMSAGSTLSSTGQKKTAQ